jgi:hypothetical protein
MGKKSDLSLECQKFVKMLLAFFSKEKATKKSIVSFDRVESFISLCIIEMVGAIFP